MKCYHKSHTASIDVDAQNCFTEICPDELPVANGTDIVADLNEQAHYAARRIGTKDAHPRYPQWLTDESHPIKTPIKHADNMDLHWPSHAVPGTKGFELIDGLPHPSQYDFFVWKGIEPDMHPYGNCYHDLKETMSTGLVEYLRDHDIQCVIVGGLATEHCVKNTALQLRKNHFDVILNLSASRGLDETATQEAIHDMQQAGIIVINQTSELANFIKDE